MAEPLNFEQVVAIIAITTIALFALPYILNFIFKFAASAAPALAEFFGGIWEDWLETWREFVAEIKEIFKG